MAKKHMAKNAWHGSRRRKVSLTPGVRFQSTISEITIA